MAIQLADLGDKVWVGLAAKTLRLLLPLLKQSGIAMADEVAVDTFGQRYAAELASSGAVHSRIPMVSAWTETPIAWYDSETSGQV